MKDKTEIRRQIITYLCGEDELSPKFINLLKAGGLTKKDGEIIKNKLNDKLDTNLNIDLLFYDYFLEQCGEDSFPADEMSAYRSDEQYLQLLKMHFPQNVKEGVDIVISMMDDDEIEFARQSEKLRFTASQHFGYGLFIRNNFGINQNLAGSLLADIERKSDRFLFMADDMSGYILDEVWEEIQKTKH